MPLLPKKSGLLDDFLALVVAAVATCLVGELQSAAVAALDQRGRLQLPNVAATLIAASLGMMSLRYCHILAPPRWNQFSSDFNILSLASAEVLSTACGQVQSCRFLPHTGQSPKQSALHSSTVGIWNKNS